MEVSDTSSNDTSSNGEDEVCSREWCTRGVSPSFYIILPLSSCVQVVMSPPILSTSFLRGLVGRHVVSEFDGKLFGGTVTEYNEPCKWFTVEYDDECVRVCVRALCVYYITHSLTLTVPHTRLSLTLSSTHTLFIFPSPSLPHSL